MIFGKTKEDRVNEEQKKLKKVYGKEYKRFAWYPVLLDSGKYVW